MSKGIGTASKSLTLDGNRQNTRLAFAFGSYTYEMWDDMISINLTGVFNGLKESVAALKAGAPSSVIMVSSTAGLQGYASLPGYVCLSPRINTVFQC